MKFGAVIVTYNRIEHLRKSIFLYTQQTMKPEYIVVVDNASTDGTDAFLKEWLLLDEGVHKEAVFLPENMGGSGGFYTGLEKMLQHEDVDWIWVADDDAYPAQDAFERAYEYITGLGSEADDVAAVCGGVGTDGGFSNMQRFHLSKSVFGTQDMPIPRR